MSSAQGSRVVSVFVPHGPVAFEVTEMLKLPMGAEVTLLSTWSLPLGLRYVFAVDYSEAHVAMEVGGGPVVRRQALKRVNCCKCGQRETVLASDPEGEFTCIKCIHRENAQVDDLIARSREGFDNLDPLAKPDNGQIPVPKPYKWRFF